MQYIEVCLGCVLCDGFHEDWTAPVAIAKELEPEISALSRSSEGAPSAPNKQESKQTIVSAARSRTWVENKSRTALKDNSLHFAKIRQPGLSYIYLLYQVLYK
jgi:hypothetical protein